MRLKGTFKVGVLVSLTLSVGIFEQVDIEEYNQIASFRIENPKGR